MEEYEYTLEDYRKRIKKMIEKNSSDSSTVVEDNAPELNMHNSTEGERNMMSDDIRRQKEEEEMINHISSEVKRILAEKEKSATNTNTKKQTYKKEIKKPKTKKYYRYTIPKKRSIISRIINRRSYEKGKFGDIEDYLYDNYARAHIEIEKSRNAEKRRDQRLYKRVQKYEDAREDITTKRVFIGMKALAIATLIAAAGISVNLLTKQLEDITNSGYVSTEKENSKLANASDGQILHAERILAEINYDFKHLSHSEQLDTVIRSGNKVSNMNENEARGTANDFLNFSDQKLIESILEETYEGEYATFSNEKKLELKQLVYEMLDENVKKWIRSPEKVEEIKTRNQDKNNDGMELG